MVVIDIKYLYLNILSLYNKRILLKKLFFKDNFFKTFGKLNL